MYAWGTHRETILMDSGPFIIVADPLGTFVNRLSKISRRGIGRKNKKDNEITSVS